MKTCQWSRRWLARPETLMDTANLMLAELRGRRSMARVPFQLGSYAKWTRAKARAPFQHLSQQSASGSNAAY
jgi:hypothetical protein